MTETLFDFGDAANTPETEASPTAAPPEPTNRTPDGLFDFGDTAGPAPVAEPRREITDPRGGPRVNQPAPRQWSVFGTPIPGTQAAAQGEEIHPLSRAVLQNFDMTTDISGNSAALKKIVSGVYGPNYDANRAAPIPVADLTDDELTKIVDQPRMQRALQLDSITRRRMAEDAEEAAILRGEISFMLAAEGSVDTMVRMMRAPETRTPEAIMAQQDRGFLSSAANAIERGINRPRFGLLISFAQSKAARGRAAGGNPWQTFSDAFKESAFGAEGSAQRKVQTIPNPIDLLYGIGQGVGSVGGVYLSGGYNEATVSRLEKEARVELEDAFRALKRSAATTPMSRPASRFMRRFQELPDDLVGALAGFFNLLVDDPAGFTAASSEVLAEQSPTLAASALVRKPLGGVAAISTRALGTYVSERFNVDAQRIAFVKKKTGIDLNTVEGRADFLSSAEAQKVFSAYGKTRAAIIATGVGVGGAYFRGGTLVPMQSLTGRFAEQTLVSGLLDGLFEYGAAVVATGKGDVKEAIAEAAFGTNPVSVAIESTLSGRADYARLNDSKKAKAWLEGSTEIKGNIAGIPVVKLDTAASVMGEKLESEGIETVHITASELYTFDQDGEVAETLGLNPEDVARAAAEGGTVEVSASTFVRHILGKDGFDALIEHTMFDPTGMTPAEARQYDEEGIGDQIQQQIEERVRSSLAPGLDESSLTKLNTDMSTIQDQVAGQLEATGKYDANKSRLFGLLAAQRYATRAIRLTKETGQPVDAAALYEADNLQIQGGQPAADGLTQEGGFEQVSLTAARLTGERIDRILMEYGYSGVDLKKSKGSVAFINPQQFVEATTDARYTPEQVAEDAGPLDAERLAAETQTPYIRIDTDGTIVGHEGRHRMAALARAGVTEVPVIVQESYGAYYEAQASRTLRGQFDSETRLDLRDVTPLSEENSQAVLDKFGGGDAAFLFQDTQTPRFKKWFKDSKVVDADGNPMVVYHGTNNDFAEFLKSELGSKNFMAESAREGFFFGGSPTTAENYVGMNSMDMLALTLRQDEGAVAIEEGFAEEAKTLIKVRTDMSNAVLEEARSDPRYIEALKSMQGIMPIEQGTDAERSLIRVILGDFPANIVDQRLAETDFEARQNDLVDRKARAFEDYVNVREGRSPNIMPVYLSMQNPYVYDYENASADGEGLTDHIKRAKAAGNDGVIFKNLADGGGKDNIYIVFEPTQIKSTFNRGAFDPADPNILYQEEVGNFSLKEDAKGFATVYGDVEDIRAALPDGIRGTVVPGGLRFTPNFAPRVAAALRGDETAFSRAGKVVQARKNKAGKYIGASAANNTAAKRAAWRKQFNQLALEGKSGRFWYENSGAAVLELTGGDIAEAKKFIALLAIYSPRANVSSNSTFALRAWAQYKAGDPISVKTGVQDGQASAVLYDGTPWKGEKTNNFYINLLRQVDPSVVGKQGATIDMWMMHAGGYNKDYSNSSEYAFMENETNYLANELGWEPQQVQAAVWVAIKARMENPEVKRRTEEVSAKRGWIHYEQNAKGKSVRVVDDERKHFGNWFKQGMAHDVTTDDTKTAKFDFSDGIARHTGQISWEARPSTSVPILEGVHDAPYEQQLELQLAIMEALSDADGADRLAQYLGILADGSIVAPGVWEGDISPSAQATVAMAPATGGVLYASKSDSDAAPLTKAEYDALSKADRANYQKTPAIDLSQQKTLKLYTSVLGLLLRQDGVGYHKPFLGASTTASNGMEFLTGQSLTPAEAQLFNDTFDLRMQEAGFAGWEYNVGLISSAEGMRVVSFDTSFIPNKKLHAIAKAAFTEVSGSDSIKVEYFATDGGLAFNDWKENSDGQDYIREIKDSGRPDVLGWAGDVLYPEIQKVYADFSSRYGWGAAGQLDFFERGEHRQTAAFEQQRGAAGPRGGFTPSDLINDQDGNPVNLIQIFEKADPTTFLHESGHFWLEQLKADARAVGGGLQQDFKAVTDWWARRPLELREEAVRRAKKKKDKDSVAALQQMTEAQVSAYARSGELRGEGPSRYLSVAMHEQFARGVENYFATGRAPSLSLAGVFSAFKVWVGSVYAKLAGAKLDVQFSAEVTAVIDRMLAADEEIALIEGQYNLAAMYTTAEQAGMTPTQFSAYQKKIAETKDDRRARQLAKHIKELKRERTAWWNDERETLREETEQEVAAEPAYRLLYALTNQGLADGSTLPEGEALDRMDRGLLKELLEAEGFSLDDIPRIDSKAVYEADGLSPGVVAQTFGYDDVDAMILDLVGRQPYAQAVDEAIDAKMEEEHGSIESSGEIEALASAYSDKTAQVLAAELAALRTTEPAFKQAFVRAYARDRLLELPSAQIRPYRFLAAEKRHANMAGDALKRGDRVAAYQHQFQRLVNHYMATEALKAQRDIEKKTRYLKAFTKRGKKFPTIEADYVDNILRILAAVNFGQGAVGQQSRLNEIVALQEFIEEKQAADGSILDVPAWLTDTTGSVANSTREISYLQFLQLHETIKRYEQQGRTANKIRRGDEELSLAEGKASLLSVLDGMNKSRVQRLRGKTASARGVSYTVASVIALADAQLLKVEALLEAIDGKIMGPWHQTIYEPFNQAAADKYRLQEKVSQVIGELISNLPKDVRRGFGKRVDVGALGTPGMTFTRGELIMMALNVGNESNLDKFIRGMGGDPKTNVKGAGWNINEELIDAALDNLTEEEWSLVRGVWEHAEELYPTVEGIYRREHGISPDRVEPRTVKTKFGEFKGGYFPMMYDRSIAGVAVDLQQKTALQLMQAETGRASINSSMTKARTGYAAPVDLDISRLALGLDNTIHFITHYEAVRNANKILGDRDIRAELETKVGIAYTEQLTKWVAALASNGNDSPPVDIFQQGIQKLYNNTTIGVLGFSYSTLAMQTLGLFNGQDRLLADSGYGPAGIAVLQKDMAAGVAAAFRPSHIDFVIQASGEMQGRRKSMDREVSQVLRNLAGKDGVVTGAQRFSMQAIAEVQFYTVDIPVWTAAYNRAQRGIVPGVDTGDTDAAIKYADRVVRMSQSAGGLKDLAAIQRHKGLIKGLTMFYSFFSALYAVLRSVGVEFTQNAKEKPIAATGRAATRMFVLLALQSVATGFIRGDMPDWDEEDEKKKSMLEYLAKESVSTALGTVPVVREIAAGWANGYGYSGGAGTIAFDSMTKAMGGMEKFINELGEEETVKSDGDYEDLARRAAPYVLLTGALRGVPAVQINRTLDGLGAMYDEADNWHWSDLLRGYNAERAKRRED